MDTKSGIENHNKFFCKEPEFLFDGIPKKIQLKFIRWTKTVLLKKTPLYMLIVAWTSLLISCLPNVEKELKKLKQIYIGPQNVPLYYNKLAVEFKRKIVLLEYVRIFEKKWILESITLTRLLWNEFSKKIFFHFDKGFQKWKTSQLRKLTDIKNCLFAECPKFFTLKVKVSFLNNQFSFPFTEGYSLF